MGEAQAPEEVKQPDGYGPRAAISAALAMVLIAGMGVGISWLTVDVSNQAMFVEGDPALVAYDEFRTDFGSDESVFVLVDVPDAFADPYYQQLIDLGEALDKLSWVADVRSPLRSPIAFAQGDEIVSKSVAEVAPKTPEDRAFWREKATQFRPFKGLLISEDAQHVGFLARLEHTVGKDFTPQDRKDIVAEFTSVLQSDKFKDLPHSALGTPVNPFYFSQILNRELRFATLLGLLAAGACLFLLFRSLRAVVAPLLVSICSLVGAVGCMGWFGMPVTMMTPILLSLLICVGVADAMHLLSAYQRLMVTGGEPAASMRAAIAEVWRPCLYTSVTTAVGFGALTTSEIVPVRHLGMQAALGSLLAYVLTFAIGPLISLGWRPRSTPAATALTRLMDGMLWVAKRGRWWVVGIAATCLSVALFGGFPTVDNDFMRTMRKGEPFREWIEFTHERMGGVVSAELVLEATDPGNTEELAEILRRASEFGAWMTAESDLVSKVSGVFDAVEEMHVLYDGPREVPENDAANEQLLLMVQLSDRDFYEQHITLDGSSVRLTLRMEMAPTSHYGVLKEQIEAEVSKRFLREDGTPLATTYLTGAAMLMSRANEYLIATQIESFGIALLCVSLLVFFGVRNLKLGLLSLVPNLLPIALVVGTLAWLEIRVSMTTALVGAIVLGIIVDDTIHVIERLRHALNSGLSVDDALHETVHSAGRAVIFTSLTLTACFAIYLFSALTNIQSFGLLTAATFVLALVADLLVLPALMHVVTASPPTDTVEAIDPTLAPDAELPAAETVRDVKLSAAGDAEAPAAEGADNEEPPA